LARLHVAVKQQRPVDDVVADVREGYVSPLAAHRDYGVALECVDRRWLPKAEETARLRLAAQRDLGA
jgi:hypothetical protein